MKKLKFMFNEEIYETHGEAEEAVYKYAEDVFDDVLDECYGDVTICGYTYQTSYALKHLDEIAYRCALLDYADSLMYDIEEIDDDEE